jgi:hypothetical protein
MYSISIFTFLKYFFTVHNMHDWPILLYVLVAPLLEKRQLTRARILNVYGAQELIQRNEFRHPIRM